MDRYLAGTPTLQLPTKSVSKASECFDPMLMPESTIAYPEQGAQILSPRILTLTDEPANLLRRGQEYQYCFDVRFNVSLANVRCSMLVKMPDGRELGGLISSRPGEGMHTSAGFKHRQCFRFRCNLLPGTYFVNAGVVGPDDNHLHRIIDATIFAVLLDSRSCGTGHVDLSSIE
jgi:lipopolysaccharide transport system ATP-binding protein